jgi:hypothetical protein
LNRKELPYAAVGVALGAAGCSPQMKSLVVPAANAEVREETPHLETAVLTLISGTTRDASSALFRLQPHSGWSIVSSDPRLDVSISNNPRSYACSARIRESDVHRKSDDFSRERNGVYRAVPRRNQMLGLGK